MPTIGDMSHGFDVQGVLLYIDELKAIVLTTAAEQIRNTTAIENACNEEWAGKAKDDYIEILRRTANHTAEQLENLYAILVSEISAVMNSMNEFDTNLLNGIN